MQSCGNPLGVCKAFEPLVLNVSVPGPVSGAVSGSCTGLMNGAQCLRERDRACRAHSLPPFPAGPAAQGEWSPAEGCGGSHCHTKQQSGKEVSWSSREHPALQWELCVFNTMQMWGSLLGFKNAGCGKDGGGNAAAITYC